MRTFVGVSAFLLSVASFGQTTPTAPATPAPPPAVAPAPPPPADAEPQGFGELKFGASIADLKTLFPGVKCKKGRKEKDGRLNEWCELQKFELGQHTTEVNFDFLGGTFWRARVIFTSDLVDEMKELLVTKYGPTSNVETVREQQSPQAQVFTDGKPKVFEWTYTKWEWPNARVVLVDQRMHVDFNRVSRFEVGWISPEEKAAKEKALKAF
jgi:hypothetical protein